LFHLGVFSWDAARFGMINARQHMTNVASCLFTAVYLAMRLFAGNDTVGETLHGIKPSY
jgi:hypothetical protein